MLKPTPEIKAFRRSKTRVEALKGLLDDPILKVALEAVKSAAQPRRVPEFTPGTPHDTTIAHEFCEMAGVNTALLMLDSLRYGIEEVSPMEEQTNAEPEPFEDQIPAEYQRHPSLPPPPKL